MLSITHEPAPGISTLVIKQNPYRSLVAAVSLFAGALAYAPVDAQQTSQPPSAAVGSISVADDCTKIDIDYQDDDLLTPEERLARMDAAFFASLSKFDACQTSQSGTSASASGGGDTGNGDSAGGGGAAATGAVASPDLTGTDPPSESNYPVSGAGNSTAATQANKSGAALDAATAQSSTPVTSTAAVDLPGGGKLPEDIPAADNDSVLQAQIRQAAMSETDPAVRKKLWDEYRKYKGLSRPRNQPEAH